MSVTLSTAIGLASVAWTHMRDDGYSLERALQQTCHSSSSEEKAAVQSLLYTTTRNWAKLNILLPKLVSREPSAQVQSLLDVSLALLMKDGEREFTVVDQTVRCAKSTQQTAFASGFINAVLRNFLRNKSQLLKSMSTNLNVQFNAPGWWISKIRKDYPQQWQRILKTQTLPPPLTLRVNLRKTSVEDYLSLLTDHGITGTKIGRTAVVLDRPYPVQQIPGFNNGLVSIQDAGSQHIPEFISLKSGERILDACCAPGGKTAHMLECADVSITAVEIDSERAKKIEQTLARLGLHATVLVQDANNIRSISKYGPFDTIVLDAPCTASGIVRRHPDIPWSRRPDDIRHLAMQQRTLLNSMWSLLNEGSHLLYVVCSIFPEEGPLQIERFLQENTNAHLIELPNFGRYARLLPTEIRDENGTVVDVHDGFFYALLKKVA